MDKLSKPFTVTLPSVAWSLIVMALSFMNRDLIAAGEPEDNNCSRCAKLILDALKEQGFWEE